MANIKLYRGGKPTVNYMWDEADYPEFGAPFANPNYKDTPPYDSHADGAYNLGDFVIGMPINPNNVGMTWQRKMLSEKAIAVGDIIQCAWLPEDHFATAINVKSVASDAHMAGATVALVTQTVTPTASGDFTIAEDAFLDEATKAQLGANAFNVAEPFNARVSLFKVTDDYAVPLYSKPSLPAKDAASGATYGSFYVFGLKVLTLPTDTKYTLADMRKGIYVSVRMQAFECPTNY